MKLNKFLTVIGALGLTCAFTACSDDDDNYDYPGVEGQVVLAPTVNKSYKIVKTPVGMVAPSIDWSNKVRSRIKATEDIVVKFEIDNALVDAYNEENETDYVAMPDGLVTLEVPVVDVPEDESTASRAGAEALVTVAKGTNNSTESVIAKMTDDETLLATLDVEKTYIVPVRMTEVVKGDARVAVSGTNVSYLTFSLVEAMINEGGSPTGKIVPKANRQTWTGTPGGGASDWYGWNNPIRTESGYNFGSYPAGSYVDFDFGETKTFDGVYIYPFYGQSGYAILRSGTELFTSDNGQDWTSLGTLTKTSSTVTFYVPVTARYLRVQLGVDCQVACTAFSIYEL